MAKKKKIKQGQNSLEAQQKAGNIDKDGYYTMPQVPQERGRLFNPVKLQQGFADSQQEILQTPRAKQKNRDAQDPFKNNFFKSKEELYRKNEASQNADRIMQQNQLQNARGNVEQLKKEQAAGTDERTNAQKLFAPAVPDIQTDKAGNKLASKKGKPVGFSGMPKGAKAPDLGNRGNPNILGMTDAERVQNQQSIQNVAENFEPYQLPQPTQAAPALAAFPQPQGLPPTPFASSPQGLPNDTPGAASVNARALAFANAKPLQNQQSALPQVNTAIPPDAQLDPLSMPGLIPKLKLGWDQNKNIMSDWWTRNIMGEPGTTQQEYVKRTLPIVRQKRAAVGM